MSSLKNWSILGLSLLAGAAHPMAYAAPAKTVAIFGGQGDAPYAATLKSNGSVKTVPGLPATGLTYRVGINASGRAIFGGTSGDNAYAAFVSPRGKLTPIRGLLAPGEIYTTAISATGRGIVGGGHVTSGVPYAALVAPTA
jgi:hypothetical protein